MEPMDQHKRFLLFEDCDNPRGGFYDIMGSFDSLEEVHNHFDEEEDIDFDDPELEDTYYVYDRIEGRVVWCSRDWIFQYF